jgi:regulator of replication initiation timing
MATNILQSQKRSYADVTEKLSENPLVKPVEKQVTKEVKESFDAKQSSEINFDDVAAFEAEIYAQMDEIEELLEEEDANLISIDGRYVEQIESENWAMNMEIIQLRAALINLDQMYQAEAAKVRAFNASSVDL